MKIRLNLLVERRNLSMISIFILCFLSVILCDFTTAQENYEWPCFHGLARNSKSAETGLLTIWSDQGPERLWTVSGLGVGYSSVTIAQGMVFTAGMIEKQAYVFAFNLDGNPLWKKPNGPAWETTMRHAMSYTGSRSTPTVDDGVVYHLGELGRLTAFEYRSGDELWSLELMEAFDAEVPEYGYTESIFIDGERLYCHPAGKKGFTACLKKSNGEIIWSNTDIPGNLGFSSPVVAEFGDYRQMINLSSTCVFGLDADTGKLLWDIDRAIEHRFSYD